MDQRRGREAAARLIAAAVAKYHSDETPLFLSLAVRFLSLSLFASSSTTTRRGGKAGVTGLPLLSPSRH
ncbi:uncharacterized protein DS421_4g132780 [Arachis hypogaea]|nr:uncharacterized protein DS421_4g132780 [Arachis hypogaea]